mgnify:CR=1 FL=1|jgi:DNA-binding Lrp family transcriptional regulator
MKKSEKEVLDLISHNASLSPAKISQRLNINEKEIVNIITRLQKTGVIVGYETIINWGKTDRDIVSAFIEVKVIPQQSYGFDAIAKQIYLYPEVDSIYLMSGGFDFAILIEGKSLKDVSSFISEKLSTLPYIQSTSTHFVLKKYKDHGAILEKEKKDPRLLVKA